MRLGMTTEKREQLLKILSSPAGIFALKKQLAEKSLHDFVKQAWHVVEPDVPFTDNWHIAAICDHLQAVSDEKIPQLLINIPPGTSKSMITGVFWPAWEWTTRPGKRFMFSSYSESLSLRDSMRARDLITSDWYQKRWAVKIKDDQNSKSRFSNNVGGWRIVGSVSGRGIGEHPDFNCVDGETRVQCRNGIARIKDIVERGFGTEVLSYNHHTKQTEYRAIVSRSKKPGQDTIAIRTVTGKRIIATRKHPVFVIGKGYISAGDLQKGDRLVSCVRNVQNGICVEEKIISPKVLLLPVLASGTRSAQGKVRRVRNDDAGKREEVGHSPYRLQGQQRFDEPDLSVLSRKTSRWKEIESHVDTDVVDSVEDEGFRAHVYDIGVEANHNFFAEGVLVHNCADDPHNVLQAESEADRTSVLRWFEGVFCVRGEARNVKRVLIMQRLHSLDCSGVALEKKGWCHICLPMRYEIDHPFGTTKERATPLGFYDPRTVDGELLWPAIYSAEKVANLEVNMGVYVAAGQLQQRPSPRGGGMFKRDWFQILPVCPRLRKVVAYVDKAGTAGGSGAETAIVLFGEYEDAMHGLESMRYKYVMLDVIHGRWEAAGREAVIKQTAQIYEQRYGFVDWWVEEEPGSGGKESAQGTIANLVGFSVKAEKVTGDKATRAEPLASQASVGKVKMLAAAWNNYALDELEVFPMGKLKDIVDAASGGFAKLWHPGGGIGSASELRTGKVFADFD